ncbi:hypothetical protein LOD99_13527 [Oopsacas minuta]|uniref:Uncharacterized protein n=1 Tax=Oopsacas minuta TaxID=111878 RepID=A0AAV7KQQ9_9METZ|nr:hypothetical protein LOD99_13527 [Oopsacas minuta]
MSAVNIPIKLDGKTKSPGGSKVIPKDNTPSPGSEKKFSTTTSQAKSNIPKSSVTKYQSYSNRSQSSHGSFNKDKVNGGKSEDSHNITRTRDCNSKTALGHNSGLTERKVYSHSKVPDRIKHKSVTNNNSMEQDSLTYSSPEPSPPASPPLNETSDDSVVVSDNPEEHMKAPFIIKKAEPDDNTHVHNQYDSASDARTLTPICCHATLLASKKRPANKRPGHLRHMKTLSVNRIQTLKDYLSIYEERLGRIKADQPLLLGEARQGLEEVITRATQQWNGLQTEIDQQYEELIKDTESHKARIIKELKDLESLQSESSTLYDICDLEEDDNNLGKWVYSIKERYNQTLSLCDNTDATDFLPSISIERIDEIRANYESQILKLTNTNLLLGTPAVANSVSKDIPRTSTL